MAKITHENPQNCSLSEPIASTMLSISVATVAVETKEAYFSTLISASFPRSLLLTYASLNADDEASRLAGISRVNLAASIVVSNTSTPGVVKRTPMTKVH